ncbi:adenosylcobinamide-GDP ribazoletransferase [Pseudomaricurvus alkylphenolicus]|uniref:adenosylcobinamide-GDP ribazoletransferase n=1 Tax=Pseudomaricurvus alkylphenolicus TaxID=1306991 RepID=UPI00141F96D9|nr:adenosylcobinamide-GDP ribazoletransferase [Pseudomaricurvus alkylphenolicus]NIB39975.1 adenosylcobinamide-GDP ribazoletransferase [Pseudomaricurvus alkylphenolicus]
MLSHPIVRAFITALAFLTRLPVPTLPDYRPQDAGRAFPLFPLVGFIIGALLALAGWWLHTVLPVTAVAAVMVALWAALTGGLHLDGLGDSADGWLAGGDRERTLTIMKDPRSGSAAVIAIVCVLLIKFAALQTLIEHQQWLIIAVTPMLGRTAALALMLSTDYVSESGIATDFLEYASVLAMAISVLLALVVSLALLPGSQVFSMLMAGILLLWALRRLMCHRLGGSTGDTTGASIEILEAALLCAALIH